MDDDSQIFPQKLMNILSEPTNERAIAWLPSGRSFVIRDRKILAEKVLPKYFSRKAKYSSFIRKLNRWNFSRVSSGPDIGSYYHEFFLRDKPHLASQMFCKNSRTILAMAALEEEQKKAAEQEKKDTETPSENVGTMNPVPPPQEPPLYNFGDIFQHEEEEEKASHLPPPVYGNYGLPWVAAHPPHAVGQNHHPMYHPMHYHPHPPPFMMPMHPPHPMMQIHNRMKELGHEYSPPQKPNSDRASAA